MTSSHLSHRQVARYLFFCFQLSLSRAVGEDSSVRPAHYRHVMKGVEMYGSSTVMTAYSSVAVLSPTLLRAGVVY